MHQPISEIWQSQGIYTRLTIIKHLFFGVGPSLVTQIKNLYFELDFFYAGDVEL